MFLIITISFCILALPVYLRCTQLSQSKFVSTDLSFENLDQEGGLPDNEKELRAYGPSALLILFHLSTDLFEQSSHLSSQRLSLLQKTFVFRC